MSPPVAVSVVVPTYQRCASVRRLLDALGRQALPPEHFEVIVVIDGSTDETCAMLETMVTRYALRVLVQPNRGRAGACNAGVRESRGEIVLLLDDDMEPEPGLLQAHCGAHERQARQGVLGAVPVPTDTAPSITARWVGTKFNRHLAALAQPGRRIDVRSFYSGNFSIRRTVLDEVGCFDESFREYGNEDVELAIRLLSAGVALVYDDRAVAIQHYEKDFAGLARDHLAKGRTAVLCASKHPSATSRLRLGTYGQGSMRHRVLRAALLACGGRWGRTPELLIRVLAAVEQARPALALRLYEPALDYFFWFGVRTAVQQRGGTLSSLLAGQDPEGGSP